jgi:hypothetical protein
MFQKYAIPNTSQVLPMNESVSSEVSVNVAVCLSFNLPYKILHPEFVTASVDKVVKKYRLELVVSNTMVCAG